MKRFVISDYEEQVRKATDTLWKLYPRWLYNKVYKSHLVFLRGIIEGCYFIRYIQNEKWKHDDNIRPTKYLKVDSETIKCTDKKCSSMYACEKCYYLYHHSIPYHKNPNIISIINKRLPLELIEEVLTYNSGYQYKICELDRSHEDLKHDAVLYLNSIPHDIMDDADSHFQDIFRVRNNRNNANANDEHVDNEHVDDEHVDEHKDGDIKREDGDIDENHEAKFNSMQAIITEECNYRTARLMQGLVDSDDDNDSKDVWSTTDRYILYYATDRDIIVCIRERIKRMLNFLTEIRMSNSELTRRLRKHAMKLQEKCPKYKFKPEIKIPHRRYDDMVNISGDVSLVDTIYDDIENDHSCACYIKQTEDKDNVELNNAQLESSSLSKYRYHIIRQRTRTIAHEMIYISDYIPSKMFLDMFYQMIGDRTIRFNRKAYVLVSEMLKYPEMYCNEQII